MDIINPATGVVISTIKSDTKKTLNSKLETLREGQKSWIKTAIEDLEYTKVKRRSMAVEYNSLFKKACKSERTFEMYEKLK